VLLLRADAGMELAASARIPDLDRRRADLVRIVAKCARFAIATLDRAGRRWFLPSRDADWTQKSEAEGCKARRAAAGGFG
jgi:hypothetical protein